MTTLSALKNERSATDHALHSRRVLLVEDELALRKVVARNLSSRGMEVFEAGTAADAILTTVTAHPDLLLLDINLPD